MSDMVHIGRDGWLFLIHGSNDVIAQYREPGFKKGHFAAWRHLLEERARLCREIGTRYYNVVVPEKLAVYDNKTGDLKINPRRSPSARLRRALWFSRARACHIDLLVPFRAQRDHEQLYLKTDTHWTHAGAYLAYSVLCRRMGVHPNKQIADRAHRETGPVSGDLGVKFEPAREEFVEGWNFPRSANRVHTNKLLKNFLDQGMWSWGGVGSQTIYRNESEGVDPRGIVIFGDSYAHQTWLPKVGALTVLMAETFREVHLVWSTAVDWNYVRHVRPAFVITEIAERFMVELPPFAIDLPALETDAIKRKINMEHNAD